MEEIACHDKYLGFPSVVGRSKKEAFASIRNVIWQRIQGFESKKLSSAGKEVLIKSVLQSIPTYAMSCFRLPKTFLEELESLFVRFWWGSMGVDKIHWLSWEALKESKWDGGLGFRDLNAFNLALLAKQVWRLLTQPNTLLARLLKAKYYPRNNILEAKGAANCSYTWRSIVAAIPLINMGVRWRVGNGEDIRVWKDRWIP